MRLKFKLQQGGAYVGINGARTFEKLASKFASSLEHDRHLRQGFYPIYCGTAHPSPPTVEDQQKFETTFDDFLSTQLPELRIVTTQAYGWTHRPKVGSDAIIRVNSELIKALETHEDETMPETPFYLIAIFNLLGHELAHVFGFYLRATGFSPLSLSQPGRSDLIPVTNKETGEKTTVSVGEGGYVFEAAFLGHGAKLLSMVKAGGGWADIIGLQLELSVGTKHIISLEQAKMHWNRILRHDSTVFILGVTASADNTPPDSHVRYKVSADGLETHSPTVSPIKAAASLPLSSTTTTTFYDSASMSGFGL
ncbi:hypothetical protein RQP46_010264 [Phenoliferia psychrophenolica]